MLEQIMTTQVGLLGFIGFLMCVGVGFLLMVWIKKEMKEDDGA